MVTGAHVIAQRDDERVDVGGRDAIAAQVFDDLAGIPRELGSLQEHHQVGGIERRRQASACAPSRIELLRGSMAATMRALPTRARNPASVVAIAVGWWAKSS